MLDSKEWPWAYSSLQRQSSGQLARLLSEQSLTTFISRASRRKAGYWLSTRRYLALCRLSSSTSRQFTTKSIDRSSILKKTRLRLKLRTTTSKIASQCKNTASSCLKTRLERATPTSKALNLGLSETPQVLFNPRNLDP